MHAIPRIFNCFLVCNSAQRNGSSRSNLCAQFHGTEFRLETLTRTDGILILTRTDGLSRNEEMKEVFRILDKDKDGFISANDLRTVSRVRQMYRVTSMDKSVKTD